jgi:4-hydroxy-3-polyprenylbenzoate decarboxylase
LEITLAITGASGALYPHRLLNLLVAEPSVSRINLIASRAALRVLNDELNLDSITLNNLGDKLVESHHHKIEVLSNDDIGAKIASGSYPVDSMVVIPCSMGTLGSIANGISRDLIQRAADVMLKERRTLVLVVRDTPFNLIHLENMRRVTLAGAVVFSATPSFYHRETTLEGIVDQFLYRVMHHLGLDPKGAFRWSGDKPG